MICEFCHRMLDFGYSCLCGKIVGDPASRPYFPWRVDRYLVHRSERLNSEYLEHEFDLQAARRRGSLEALRVLQVAGTRPIYLFSGPEVRAACVTVARFCLSSTSTWLPVSELASREPTLVPRIPPVQLRWAVHLLAARDWLAAQHENYEWRVLARPDRRVDLRRFIGEAP